MDIDDEDGGSDSGDSDNRDLYSNRQAVNDVVNNQDSNFTVTRKQRQRMASKRRRENARIQLAEIRHPAIAKHFSD